MRIAVYCSSKEDIPQFYKDDAAIIGSYIGNHRHTLVYGGIGMGLMRVVASAVQASGGRVVGVIPVAKKQLGNSLNSENLLTQDLNDRKSKMIMVSDLFIVLPGGYGTLDELISTFSFLTYIGNKTKHIIILNKDGLFDPFQAQLQLMAEKGLMSAALMSRLRVVGSAHECCEMIGNIEQSVVRTTEYRK